jgi:hypothetical protein
MILITIGSVSPKPLRPVSMTPAAPVGKFTAIVVDTIGKFVTGVNDTGVLDLRISPRIFKLIRNDPNVIFRGSGENDS